MEISVIVARGADGSLRTYVPVENRHRNHILDETIAPANLPDEIAARAEAVARHLAKEMELRGLLAGEMFDNHDEKLLGHELEPRPPHTGHWMRDRCVTSQIEKVIQAVAGRPLGKTNERVGKEDSRTGK